ncbi:MAG: glycoside hydrolase family 43 protein [Candidatus Methylacidiphilales bacterium]|nr:glycoside hydrolase family 43 protein [Candidatus Methylacidiphilales bacterium]
MKILNTLILMFCLSTATALADNAGYLFVTFKGEQTPMTEQIYFALSKDGRTWTALHGGEPVLISKLGEKGIRDPYLFRSHDGKKSYIIATDLSTNLNPSWKRAANGGSKSILIWESENLVDWTAPRLVKVAADDAGCTWAPEAVYCDETGDYLVFWASKNKSDDFKKFRIWAARTKDFVTFSAPFVYIDKPDSVIDTTIVREGSKYYRFNKDEKNSAITLEVSENLTGQWTEIPGFNLAGMKGFEGPECYQLEPAAQGKPAQWCLILDNYTKSAGYKPFITKDLSTGQFEPAQGFVFPFKFRHGSILPVSADEYQRLEAAYGSAKP